MSYARISLLAVTLFVATTVAASAAVTIRTAPTFTTQAGGFASCGVTNSGTAPATVTVTLFSNTNLATNGDFVLESDTITLPAKATQFGIAVPTDDPANQPSWCECVVPDKTKVRCSFTYVNGNNVTVLPAE